MHAPIPGLPPAEEGGSHGIRRLETHDANRSETPTPYSHGISLREAALSITPVFINKQAVPLPADRDRGCLQRQRSCQTFPMTLAT